MFMDYENSAGSMGHNFVGNWFFVLQYKMIQQFVKNLWGRKNMGKAKPYNPLTSNPMSNDDSTVACTIYSL